MEKEKAVPSTQPQIPPTLIQQGEAVARLAIELAKEGNENESSWSNDVVGRLPQAWRILRSACVEIAATGRKKTVEDYLAVGLPLPQELLPEPDPTKGRVPFSFLFNSEQEVKALEGVGPSGKRGHFNWKPLIPWDGKTRSDEPKSGPFKLALKYVNARLAEVLNKNREDLIYHLCNWSPGEDKNAILSGITNDLIHKYGVSYDAAHLFHDCWEVLPRPIHFIEYDFFGKMREYTQAIQKGEEPPSLSPRFDPELLKWANDLCDKWIECAGEKDFVAFWKEGKARGFCWNDVLGMCGMSKQGVKWIDA